MIRQAQRPTPHNDMRRSIQLLCLLSLILCTGCKTKDQLSYFQTNPMTPEQVLRMADWSLKIEPDDRLKILVSSDDPEITKQYAALQSTNKDMIYLVDKQGDIIMPVIGRVHAAGLNTTQLTEEITRRMAEYAEAPSVLVTLDNFKVSVMGEVGKPGPVEVKGERITLFEALAAAENPTLYGRRDNVALFREENGEVTYHELDLSDGDIAKSPYYYLKQNDVIYVSPNKIRMEQADYSVNNGYKIQVVSAVTSGVSVIVSLIIALTVK